MFIGRSVSNSSACVDLSHIPLYCTCACMRVGASVREYPCPAVGLNFSLTIFMKLMGKSYKHLYLVKRTKVLIGGEVISHPVHVASVTCVISSLPSPRLALDFSTSRSPRILLNPLIIAH